MGGLKNLLNGIGEKWKALSNGRKIGIIVFVSGMMVGLLYLGISMNKTQYQPLFVDMSTEDMAMVVDKLKQDKVDYKLEGSTLMVPADQVDEIRLSVAGSGYLPSSGKGYELFDQSRFGMTDTEMRIQYQRALETELARTIKAYDEVEQAIVHLVMPESSVFVRDQQPSSASVTLKLKTGKSLSKDQVKAIVALVSASVKDLPKENVVVVDSNFSYLSENLYNDDMTSTPSLANREEVKTQFESKIASDIKKMLEAVYGPDKVKVSVNADLDFDSTQITSIHYDKDSIIKSQNTIKQTDSNTEGQNSGSPIDNQTTAVVQTGGGSSQSTRDEQTTEYAVGQVEEKTIKAPGQVKRISTSVIIDGTLSDAAKASVTNIVMAATGYVNDENRKDLINVEGMPFDTTLKEKVEEDLKAMQEQEKVEERKKKLFTYIGYPAAGLAGLVLLIILISRIRASAAKNKAGGGVDVMVDGQVPVNEVIKTPPIILDQEDNNPDLVDELKKYAAKKPDQVVEIVKSWLAEDER